MDEKMTLEELIQYAEEAKEAKEAEEAKEQSAQYVECSSFIKKIIDTLKANRGNVTLFVIHDFVTIYNSQGKLVYSVADDKMTLDDIKEDIEKIPTLESRWKEIYFEIVDKHRGLEVGFSKTESTDAEDTRGNIMDGIICITGNDLEELVDSVVDYCAAYRQQQLKDRRKDDVSKTDSREDK